MTTSPIRKRTTLGALATPRGIIDALRALPSEIPADAEVIEADIEAAERRNIMDPFRKNVALTLEWDA